MAHSIGLGLAWLSQLGRVSMAHSVGLRIALLTQLPA